MNIVIAVGRDHQTRTEGPLTVALASAIAAKNGELTPIQVVERLSRGEPVQTPGELWLAR